jgi:hypothetical protein
MVVNTCWVYCFSAEKWLFRQFIGIQSIKICRRTDVAGLGAGIKKSNSNPWRLTSRINLWRNKWISLFWVHPQFKRNSVLIKLKWWILAVVCNIQPLRSKWKYRWTFLILRLKNNKFNDLCTYSGFRLLNKRTAVRWDTWSRRIVTKNK